MTELMQRLQSARELPTLQDYGLVPMFNEEMVFDHQVSGTFGECERWAYYQYVLGRTEKRTSFALDWGKAFHSATEAWDYAQSLRESGQPLQIETTPGTFVRTTIQDMVVGAITATLPENNDDRYGRTRGRMFEAFVQWLEYCKVNPIKILRTEQSVIVECRDGSHCPYFPNSPTGCGLRYGGRMDRIVEWNGIRGPKDLKTTVMDETDPLVAYRPSHQFEGYIWMASHLMHSHCWGIIVERVITNKSKIKIDRFPVSYTKDNVREWVFNELENQARFRMLATEHPYNEIKWRQNYARCGTPWPCPMRDVCLSPTTGGFRYKLLRDNFVEKRWDFQNPDQDILAQQVQT